MRRELLPQRVRRRGEPLARAGNRFISAAQSGAVERVLEAVTRVGDAERETAVAALGEHFAAGRIDRDELDGRLEAAYAALTRADLDRLFADLPGPAPFRRPAAPARKALAAARWRPAVLLASVILLVVAIFAIGLAAGGPGRAGGPGSMMGPGGMGWMHGSAEGSPTAPSPAPGATEVRIVGRDFSFSPNQVRIAAGSTVNLVLVNDGASPHDLTIPALGFRLSVVPGATATGALAVTRAGSYELYCALPGHREAGMSGMLIAT